MHDSSLTAWSMSNDWMYGFMLLGSGPCFRPPLKTWSHLDLSGSQVPVHVVLAELEHPSKSLQHYLTVCMDNNNNKSLYSTSIWRTIRCAVQYNYTYFIYRSCPRFTALYNPDKKCSHIHTSTLTRWRQWPSLARWPCLAIAIYYLWVNVGDTESGHCQGACRSQWFFYVPLQVSETALPFYVVMRATRDTQSPMLKGGK